MDQNPSPLPITNPERELPPMPANSFLPKNPAPVPPPSAFPPPMPPVSKIPLPSKIILPPHPPKKNASYGALISIVIILAIIVVGAFYSWGKRIEQNAPRQPVQQEEAPSVAATTTVTVP